MIYDVVAGKLRRMLAAMIIGAAAIPLASARADDFLPPKIVVQTPYGVNISDASFSFSVKDLSIGSLSLERFHLGGNKDPNKPFFGPRMTHNFDIYVAPNYTPASPPRFPARYKPIVHLGASTSGTYYQTIASPPTVTNSTADAAAGRLTLVSGAYVYTDQAGTVYTFNPNVHAGGPADQGGVSQRIASMAYANGRNLNFLYDSSGQLKEIFDNSGYAMVFDYNSNGDVADVCGFDLAQTYVTSLSTCSGVLLKVGYSYTGNLLTGVVDVLGQSTAYSYTGNYIICIKPPGYSACKISNTYTNSFQISQQTLIDGAIWKSSASDLSEESRDPNYVATDGDQSSTITDPLGNATHYAFTKSSPYTVIDANSHTTNYRYSGGEEIDQIYPEPMHEGHMLIEADFPEGGEYTASYSSVNYNAISSMTWKAKPGAGKADITHSYNYNSCVSHSVASCTNPIAKIDGQGNEADYTYFDFGGMQTEMDPAPTLGAARPLKTYTYTQLYAYIKNSAGTLVQAATPIWMLTSETQCQTVAGSNTPTCDTGAGAVNVATTYQYGAAGTGDTLLLRGKVVDAGTGKLNLRTCYGYDGQGNKISETSPRAGLTTCP